MRREGVGLRTRDTLDGLRYSCVRAALALAGACSLAVIPLHLPVLADERGDPVKSLAADGTPDKLPVGFTAPLRKASLASLQKGRICTIPVEEGQHVQKGDLLVSLDMAVQKAQTECARLDAESTLRIDLARVELDYAESEVHRLTKLNKETAASDRELREAQAKLDAARLNHEIAKHDHLKAQQTYRMNSELLAQRELRAPFSGFVTTRLKEVGESIEELEAVIRLEQTDTLLVNVDCPLALARTVRHGQAAAVRPTEAQWEARTGTVQFVSPVADAGSQTVKIRLEVSNGDGGWIAGLMVVVDFSGTTERTVSSPAGSRLAATSRPAAGTASKTTQQLRSEAGHDVRGF